MCYSAIQHQRLCGIYMPGENPDVSHVLKNLDILGLMIIKNYNGEQSGLVNGSRYVDLYDSRLADDHNGVHLKNIYSHHICDIRLFYY